MGHTKGEWVMLQKRLKMQESELCKSLDRIDSLVDELIDANRELEKAEKSRDQGMKFINGKEA